ncbi:hypothetical protein CY34DRAFT_808847 [Suillus luteus UH-Slu-Lm8-n1]|uniref:Unplaced genomic scaffold CY34scaffold_236, whole genome shotgun sequence n=1 Tax=Suillus luteus UH-Slu-Lm8-n1 TaxID=930992 RepID=A0A0C9ZMV8_9AGAM|nr:hypothetical protein CY34DRAFT_808847 [Suillus luteus UH-Slu-Lm8-n1]
MASQFSQRSKVLSAKRCFQWYAHCRYCFSQDSYAPPAVDTATCDTILHSCLTEIF